MRRRSVEKNGMILHPMHIMMLQNTDIMQVRVYGAFATGQHEDCTYGTPKSLPRGAAYYLPNLVYEYGEGIYSHKPDYTHAFLMFHPVNGLQGMYLHIWWSPDSI